MYDMNQNCIEIFCVLEKYLKLILRSVTIQSTRLHEIFPYSLRVKDL